ncbi:MAG TPA: glycosyltransferase family 87 protein [Blastocatellia bacterium]
MIKASTLELAPAEQNAGWARTAVPIGAIVLIGVALAITYNYAAYLHRFTQGISLYIGVYIVQFTLYLGASYAILKTGKSRSRAVSLTLLGLVVVFSVIFHSQVYSQPPYLSSDVYRYIWDGHVQSAGINPFRYIPDSPELAPLRDTRIFPNINRADYAPTPYPPVAQMIYLAVYKISPLSVPAFKAAMSLFDIITVLVVALVLAKLKMDPARAIIFGWHPLLMWEGAHSGHVDPAFITCLAFAMLAWTYRKPTLTGIALALATLVKLYPMMLLPVFLTDPDDMNSDAPEMKFEMKLHAGRMLDSVTQVISRIRKVVFNRSSLKTIAAFLVTIVVCYLPYLTVGGGVFGYLTGYFQEEGFVDSGGRYFPLALIRKLVPMPTNLYSACAVLALGGMALWWLIKRKRNALDIATGSLAMVGLYLVLTSPRYPWYFCWIIPFLCFVPRIGWLYLTGATVLLYTLWFIPDQYPNLPLWLGASMYVPTLALLARERFSDREAKMAPVWENHSAQPDSA